MNKLAFRMTAITVSLLLAVGQGNIVKAMSQNSNSVKPMNNSTVQKNKWTSTKSKPKYVKDELIIKYKDNISTLKKESVLKNNIPLSVKHRLSKVNEDVVKLPANVTVDDAVNKLKQDSNVEYVQPNYIYTPQDITTDPGFNDQWGLENVGQQIDQTYGKYGVDIDIRDAWNITKGSNTVVVGVIDTGIDTNHPDLKNNIWTNTGEIAGNGIDDDGDGYIDDVHGWDFVNDDDNTFASADEDDHGTHVAGIIAASMNYTGGVGIAPNVKIMPLKFMGSDGGSTYDAIRAIDYAKAKGVKILNMSFGGPDYDYALKSAISQSGCLVIAAAGNDGNNNDVNPTYPASYSSSNILSVAAVDNRGNLAGFSDYGKTSVDVAAPGVDILSTVPKASTDRNYDYAYEYMSGTSMAAPFVTGIAALLYSNGVTDPATIKQDIMQSVVPLSNLTNKVVSGGMVNAYRALMASNNNLSALTSFTRIGGTDRYATAVAVSSGAFKQSDYAIIATGDSFPDALSAAPLAKKYNAPILLTDSKTLTTSVSSELDRLAVKNVFIVGGTGAVSKDVENSITQKGITVVRLAGSDRYDTSLQIAKHLGANNQVFVATGDNFPDALSIASYAAAKGIPIILSSQSSGLSLEEAAYIKNSGVTKAYVIGGPGVVASSVLYSLPSAERIYGNDRYKTNLAVINKFSSDFNLDTTYFATGENFPDALSGSAAAALTNSPMLLIGGEEKDTDSYIRSNLPSMKNKKVLGGDGVLPASTINYTFY